MTELLEVGRIDKAHGLRGQVIVRLTSDRTERLDPATILESDRGSLTVVDRQPHHDRWLVTFAEIRSWDAAEQWRGTTLRAAPIEDPDVLWIHDLIGARVMESDGTDRGTVIEVQANPASDLLVLDSGALVPLRFVVGEPVDRCLTVSVPPGLFELYD